MRHNLARPNDVGREGHLRNPSRRRLGGTKPRRGRAATAKPPKGVHREVWQITQDQNPLGDGDARAAVVPTAISLHGLKDKRKITARTVTWQWQPFRNSARTDQLQLKHWVKKAPAARADAHGHERRGRGR